MYLDDQDPNLPYPANIFAKTENKDPYRFLVVRTIRSLGGDYVLAEVSYADTSKFNGNKIFIVKMDMNEFLTRSSLDPHFAEEGSDVSVLARFMPTKEGWELAKRFLDMIDPGTKSRRY